MHYYLLLQTRQLVDDFYNTLTKTKEYPLTAYNKTIIMGDFNNNLGFRLLGEEKMMSLYGFGSRNENAGGIIGFL